MSNQCAHGRLARVCEICEAYSDHAAACEQNERLRAALTALRERADKAEVREKTWHDAALEAKAERDALRERADRAELDVSVCRDAIETAWNVVNDWPAESDSDAAVRRCALRKLSEAVGKAAPRLMFEQPEGQNLYGLNYREWIDRAKAAEAERDALRERVARLVGSIEAAASGEAGFVRTSELDAIVARVLRAE